MKMNAKILEFRTIALIYPHLSLETKIELDDGKIVYANLSVNSKGEKEEYYEDSFWCYKEPLTQINWNKDVEEYYADLKEEELVYLHNMLIEFWNKNPKFENDFLWKQV